MPFPDTELARRFQSFALDDPADEFPYSARLARENEWSAEYAAAVIGEYRRFLFLAATSRQAIAPSDAVDQAWHLHVLHANEYVKFCESTFGRDLPHTPSRGGEEGRRKSVTDYEHTLELYVRSFGEEPPPEIWPPSGQRFARDRHYVRVDRSERWIVRKPRAWRALERRVPSRHLLPAAIAIATMLLVAAAWASGGSVSVGVLAPLGVVGSLALVGARAASGTSFHGDAHSSDDADGAGDGEAGDSVYSGDSGCSDGGADGCSACGGGGCE